MRTVSFLKLIDFILQLCALFLPIICAVAEGEYYYIIFGYLAVGSVQVVSCILNALALDKFYRNSSRRAYEYVLAVISLLTFIAFLFSESHQLYGVSQILQIPLYATILVSPFLAIWYMWLSYKEMMYIRSVVDRKQYI